MAHPTVLISAGVIALIGVFAGYNFVAGQLENSEIKEQGLQLSDSFITASFSAAAGANGARLKSDNATAILRAKDFPPTRDNQWEGLAKSPECSNFWVQTRDATHRIAYSWGRTGIYSDEELEKAARIAKVSVGILAKASVEIGEKSALPQSKLDEMCKKATDSLSQFEAEASKRVARKLLEPAMPPEKLAAQTVKTLEESTPAFFRAFHYAKN